MYFLKKAVTIVFGSLLVAMGLNVFLMPFGLLDGGALGISLIFHYVMGVKVGFTFMLVSIPIFILAWIFYRSFFFNGVHGMLLSSLIIDVLSPLQTIGKEFVTSPLLAAIGGGIMIGIGIGLMLRLDTSIGGMDLFAQMIANKMGMNPGWMIFYIDLLIVTAGSFVIPSVQLLLSMVTVLCVGMTTSLIVSNVNKATN
ncbi:YitT family protein [Sporosarcina sp. YIM B06819]|uniref:YitT family protein n=1 Tax=Sporosarcina sp. YIM B06819 TaxID=3081769 RepID=UPI00298CB502|nr:YitT family protein [Sporosarcina sp. YIM B06819]